MKTAKMITCVLGSLLVLNGSLQGFDTTNYDLNVGTGNVGRIVNWGPRVEQTSGTWGVSSESYLGFTLTSMINGVAGAELSWAGTAENNRALGVGGTGSHGNGWGINRNNLSTIIEAIRLDLPAEDAPVGPVMTFRGISQLAFDRLDVATGAIVTISGFAADPQASWVTSPSATAPILSYNAGTLSFESLTTVAGGSNFGLISFANLDATLSPTGVSLVLSNDRNTNNANAYGLVGWQYAAVPETATQGLLAGVALLGVVLVRRMRSRARG